MFAGFNLQISESDLFDLYFDKGKKVLSEQKKECEKNLKKYVCDNGSLDGSLMQQNWFPNIKADIFISHSHKDEELVVALAGWLYEEFKITAFVDSYIWGYANDLLKIVDSLYCVNERNDLSTTYSYEKRNNSTSHVHMMLNTALEKMIDRCECLFFVNTPNSIEVKSTMEIGTTLSPWIYSEIVSANIIRHKKLSAYRPQAIHFSKDSINETASLQIKYDISLKGLNKLTDDDLLKWSQSMITSVSHPLDMLYYQLGILKNPIL